MKLLMTADAVGGVWTYAMELCGELTRSGVEVVLAGMGPRPSAAQRADALSLHGVRLEWAPFKLEWMVDPWSDVERAGEWLQALARRERVDLVHLNGYVHAALPLGAPVVIAAHSCVCSWWRAVHRSDPPREWDEYRRRVLAGVRAASHVVAPTRAFLADVQRWYGPLSSHSVIHNARTPGPFEACSSTPPQPFVFACGRLWDEAKNMRALDRAAGSLWWPVLAAGERCSPDGALFRLHGMRGLGVLTPAEVARWLGRAAIYVHPARYEPFGLSVLEAALSGCALVLADLPSLRELWTGAALFTSNDDPRAISASLERLIAEPALRERLSKAARERARQFAPAAMGAQYLRLYRKALVRTDSAERDVA